MNLQWAQSWLDKFDDVDAMMEFYNEDVKFEDVTFPFEFPDREGVREFFKGFGAPGAGKHRFVAHRYLGTDKEGTIDWTWISDHEGDFMGHPAAGKHTEIRGVSMMTFRNGKIATQTDLWDAGSGFRQLGIA